MVLVGLAEFSLIGELWEAEAQSYRTFGALYSQKIGDKLDIDLGSEYSLYKFSQFFGDENEDVRTWFLRARYDISEKSSLRIDFSWEVDDRDTYKILSFKHVWRF